MDRIKRLLGGISMLVVIFFLTGISVYAEELHMETEDIHEPKLVIDNEHCYEGMKQTYSEGYVPQIVDGKAVLVVPLLCNSELKDEMLRVSVDFGEEKNNPFVQKNYIKSVRMEKGVYVAVFEMELKKERVNGSYTVLLHIQAETVTQEDIREDIKLYVTISDGKMEVSDEKEKKPSEKEEPEQKNPMPELIPEAAPESSQEQGTELPDFAPKVMIESCKFSKVPIEAGDEFTIEITLKNTSKESVVRNMTVMISGAGEYFRLLDKTDTVYIDRIPPGKTKVISYRYNILASAPQAQYELALAMDYADEEGKAYTANGKANVFVGQPVKMQFDAPVFGQELQVADVVNASIQAMNIGRSKVYNVRAELKADGLMPEGTIFIGNVEPGATGSGTTMVTATSLSEGDASYGKTKGTVTFYYEDESGKEYMEEKPVSARIVSPFSEENQGKEEKTGQWWVIMGAVLLILCVLCGIIVAFIIKKRKLEDELVG